MKKLFVLAVGISLISSLANQAKAQTATPLQPCGLMGNIAAKIQDCAKQASSTKGGFVLISRTADMKEIYEDMKTKVIWGDRLPTGMTLDKARTICRTGPAEIGNIVDSLGWGLPSRAEYETAETDGIRDALPNMDSLFWVLPVIDHSGYVMAFTFQQDGSTEVSNELYNNGFVRCVAYDRQ